MTDARHFHAEETLRDGTRVTIRAARPDDKELITTAFSKLEKETIYTRFFSYRKGPSDAELARLDTVDFVDQVMLVATVGEDADEAIVASARYAALPGSGPRTAEVAFIVEEDYQGRGIASRLLGHLVDLARANGFERLHAEVLQQNRPMLAVFARCGLSAAERFEDGVVHLDFTIGDATA